MKLKHYDHDGRARFITFCTHRKLPLLTNNIYHKIVVNRIDEVRRESGFKLLGYVIMPEHIHLVMVPRINTKAGDIIGEIKMCSPKPIYNLMKTGNGKVMERLMVRRSGKEKFAFGRGDATIVIVEAMRPFGKRSSIAITIRSRED